MSMSQTTWLGVALTTLAMAGTQAAADAEHRCKVEWQPYIEAVETLDREERAKGKLLFQDFDDWSIYDCASSDLSERTIHQIEDMSRATAGLLKQGMWPDGNILDSPICTISPGDVEGVAYVTVLLPGHPDPRLSEALCLERLKASADRR